MACKCYHAERNFFGKIEVCWGTKECEACSCGGDESKCDFYEDKRKKAAPKTTRADHVRAMTDEELAEWKSDRNQLCPPEYQPGGCPYTKSCYECWLEALKKEEEKMYIMKCDRCGKEKKIKSLLPIFGKEDDPRGGKKYSITALGEFREITLCQDCEAALEKWIEDKKCEDEPHCENCKYSELSPGIEPCRSCDHKSNWEA